MSQQPPENSDSQQPDANSTQQADISTPQNVVHGHQNRVVQGNENKVVQGDNNIVIQDNTIQIILNKSKQVWVCKHTFTVRSNKLFSAAFSAAVNSLVFSPDSQTLISSSEDWNDPIKIWNINTGEIVGGSIRLWNLMTKQEISSDLIEDRGSIGNWKLGRFSRLALSIDGEILAIGGTFIELWNLKTQNKIGELGSMFGHRDMSALAISPDKRFLASSSLGESPFNFQDYSIKLWNLKTKENIYTLKGHLGCVRSLVFSPDSQQLISAGKDALIKLWNLETGKETHSMNHKSPLDSIAVSPDGQTLVSSGKDLAFGKLSGIRSLAFRHDGKLLAAGGTDSKIKIFSTQTMKEVCILEGHKSEIRSLIFSPNGQTIASADKDSIIKIWQLKQ
ncbi:WD40 repeat domain-containing protein [uncultured Nostoc sp.]|uniref:WD40 repeat domain-containing protein n=1 Tax=uncultured Nostoc sp. TaxID=340711 RepID=UPI0035CA3A0A